MFERLRKFESDLPALFIASQATVERGSEEAQALAAAAIPFEVVPGVTAGIAAPAYAGIPVTHRGVSTSVTFVTGSEDPGRTVEGVDWSALARVGGTIVLYMGVKSLPRIVTALTAAGMNSDAPAAAIEWGTYAKQRTVRATLSTLSETIERERLGAPVITVIGPVTALRDEIAWFDRRPLFGKRIVVTRASAQSASLTAPLAAAGAEVIEMPASRIEPLDGAPLRAALSRLAEYDWIVFTSQNAVEIVWDALRAQGRDARALAGLGIAAVGPATASALLDHGLAVDVRPERFVAEGLLDALRARDDVRGSRVLYAAAEGARETLSQGLEALGARVERLTIYRSVPDGGGGVELRQRIEGEAVDLVTFTSASSVRGFISAVGGTLAQGVTAASIGPITTAAAREAGIDVVVEATESTIPGLVDAIVRHYTASRLPASASI